MNSRLPSAWALRWGAVCPAIFLSWTCLLQLYLSSSSAVLVFCSLTVVLFCTLYSSLLTWQRYELLSVPSIYCTLCTSENCYTYILVGYSLATLFYHNYIATMFYHDYMATLFYHDYIATLFYHDYIAYKYRFLHTINRNQFYYVMPCVWTILFTVSKLLQPLSKWRYILKKLHNELQIPYASLALANIIPMPLQIVTSAPFSTTFIVTAKFYFVKMYRTVQKSFSILYPKP